MVCERARRSEEEGRARALYMVVRIKRLGNNAIKNEKETRDSVCVREREDLRMVVRISCLISNAVERERACVCEREREREREDLRMVMRISCLISNAVKSLIASLCVRFQLTEKFSMVSFRRMSHAHRMHMQTAK